MPQRQRLAFVLVLGIAISPLAASQTDPSLPPADDPNPSPSRNDVVAASGIFFGDDIEFPMRQELAVSVSKGSAPLKVVNNASMDYVFHGYRTGSKKRPTGEMESLSFAHWLHAWEALKDALNGDALIFLPPSLLLGHSLLGPTGPHLGVNVEPYPTGTGAPHPVSTFAWEVSSLNDDSGGWTVILTPQRDCPAFAMTRAKRWTIPDMFCGIAEFRLRDDLSVESFTFYAGGLPSIIRVDHLGRTTVRSYRVEADFREVLLPESADPFLAPRSVTTTLETDKGKLVISSHYEPERDIEGERFSTARK